MKRSKKLLGVVFTVLIVFCLFATPAAAITEGDVQGQVNSQGREAVAGNVFVWFLCAIGFLKISQKIDSFMSSLGINVGHTGGSMLAEAVIAARGVSIGKQALGAGSGRWSMHAACIARAKGMSLHLIMVEAEPVHFAGIKNCLEDNGVPEECCTCYEAAVIGDDKKEEITEFPLVVRHFGFANCTDPYAWRGQYVIRIRDSHKIRELPETYYGKQLFELAGVSQFIRVPTITLNRILEIHGKVDLLIMDIQGEEANVVRGAKDMLGRHVGKIGVETHSLEIDREIREILEELGWEKVVDHRIDVTGKPPPEFFDQYLYYRNPCFRQEERGTRHV